MTRSTAFPVPPMPVSLPEGMRWEAERQRVKVYSPRLADLVLRDPHIITGIDRSRPATPRPSPDPAVSLSIPHFFEMWYTVGDQYDTFNSELRKAFTPRVLEPFEAVFRRRAQSLARALPEHGDLVGEYLTPYVMTSTFALLGIPEEEWANLSKVSTLIIHLFKQELRGEWDHGERLQEAFDVAVRYLLTLTDQLLAGTEVTPFLSAARALVPHCADHWPIAALLGQLVMAGIEPMIVGSAIATARVWGEPGLLADIRTGRRDLAPLIEEALRQTPPFGNIFRFVSRPCECLGVRLEPGTILAIDVSQVHLAQAPAHRELRACPVGPSDVLTFGKGQHFCLGAHSARMQMAAGVRHLIADRPDLQVDSAGLSLDTLNNLKEVRALPFRTG